MASLNKVFNAASQALWNGDSNTQQPNEPYGEDEPMSGVQGKGTAIDPYDGGNRVEQPDAPITLSSTNSNEIEPPDTELPIGPNPEPAEAPAPEVTPTNGAIGGGGEEPSGPVDINSTSKHNPDGKASQEALRGPSHPKAREEYSFEKEIDGRPAEQPNTQKDVGNTMSSKEHHHGARDAIEKMKNRIRGSGKTDGNHANK